MLKFKIFKPSFLTEIRETEEEKKITQLTFKEYYKSLEKKDPEEAIKIAEELAGEPFPTLKKQFLDDLTNCTCKTLSLIYEAGKMTVKAIIILIPVFVAIGSLMLYVAALVARSADRQ